MKNVGKFILAMACCVAGVLLFAAFTNKDGKPLTPQDFFDRIHEYTAWSKDKLTDLMHYFTNQDTVESYYAAAAVRDMIKSKVD